MPEIIEILNKITEAKGPEFTEGLVVGVNLTTPKKKEPKEDKQDNQDNQDKG